VLVQDLASFRTTQGIRRYASRQDYWPYCARKIQSSLVPWQIQS
jgi:hypothetical protein